MRRTLLWLIALLSLINAVRVLRDPDALRVFAVEFVVAASVLAVGAAVAAVIVAIRRLATR